MYKRQLHLHLNFNVLELASIQGVSVAIVRCGLSKRKRRRNAATSTLKWKQNRRMDKNASLPMRVYLLTVCPGITCYMSAPQWGAADAEIKVPSGENTELKRSSC